MKAESCVVAEAKASDVSCEWLNPAARETGGPSVDVSIFEQFRRVAQTRGSAPALEAGAMKLSYAELLQAVESLGEAMFRQASNGGPVALSLQTGGWTPVAMLACLRNGMLCLTLDARDPPERRRAIVEDAKPTLILTDVSTQEFEWIGVPQLVLTQAISAAPRPTPVRPSPSVHAPALVIYTSGSTGTPKGIVQAQHGLLERVRQEAVSTGISAQDVVMPLCSLATIAGCREMLCALLSGATLQLDRWSALGAREIRDAIAARKATIIYAVPSLARVLLAQGGGQDLASVRVLRMGGESVRASDVKAARAALPKASRIDVAYSSTEAPGSGWMVPDDLSLEEGNVPIGFLWPSCVYAIVNEDGLSVEAGEPGELVVCSPFVALGHWRDGRLDEGAFPPEPGRPGSRTWRTGDRVCDEGRGLLRYLGRHDRQRKFHGLRVDLGGLEAALRQVDGVEEAVAFDAVDGELAVLVTHRPGQAPPPSGALAAAARASSPHGLQPARIHVLQTVPRLLSGKIDLKALEAEDARRREAPPSEEEPVVGGARDEEPTLDLVMTTWRSLLPQGRGEAQSFEEAGGDSLTLLNLVLQLEKGLGRPLPLARFQPSMTPRQFATAIDEGSAPAPSPTNSVSPAAERPKVFFLPGMHGDVPASARFRDRLQPQIDFVALRYPELHSILSAFPTIEDLGRVMADEIDAAQPSGDLRLLGYSLGGAVAFEAGAELLRRGRVIRFMGVLDTSLQRDERAVGLRLDRLTADPGRRLLIAQRNLCRRLSRLAASRRRGSLLLWALNHAPLSPKTRALMVLEAEGELRVLTLRAWARADRAPLPLTATLFRSEQRRASARADLGWGAYFDKVALVDFDGGHVQCLDEPYAAGNASRFVEALDPPPLHRAAAPIVAFAGDAAPSAPGLASASARA